mgnify:CR=1 FL=1|jgi:arylsulfatase A-like enzyme
MLLLAACHHPEPAPEDSAPAPTDALQFTGDSPRNLLVISVDTVRRSDVGRYSGDATTPFLDSIAEEGVVLDAHASNASWTLPGVIGALTGARPEELGVIPHLSDSSVSGGLLPGTGLLPTWLSDAGWSTDLFSTNLYLGRTYLGEVYDQQAVVEADAAALVDIVLAAIDGGTAVTGDPWMLHVHFLDPHAPYDPPESYLGALKGREALPWDLATEEGLRALAQEEGDLTDAERTEALTQLGIRYDAQLTYVDDEIARLWDGLETRGLLTDTLVLFWSDHGEQLLEHGSIGHAGSLYAEETDGVAFWWAPTIVPEAWAGNTNQEDLVPTTLNALGVAIPEEVTGTIVGHADAGRPRFLTLWPARYPPMQAVRVGRDELIYSWSGEKKLFHMGDDPTQQSNAYSPDSDVVARLWESLLPEVTRLEGLVEGETPIDPGP